MKLTTEREVFEKLQNCIVDLDTKCVQSVCNEALAAGIPPIQAIEKGLSKGMAAVGEKFERGEFFLTELLMATEVMKEGMKILEPHIQSGTVKNVGKMVVGTVEGDLHDIGKNLFATLATAAGFQVTDLGVDVKKGDFVKCVRSEKPRILGISALLTLSLPGIEDTLETLERSRLRDRVKVIVGGAAVTPQFGKKAKADFAAESAVQGVNKCVTWTSASRKSESVIGQ